jgi:hypothetical protein
MSRQVEIICTTAEGKVTRRRDIAHSPDDVRRFLDFARRQGCRAAEVRPVHVQREDGECFSNFYGTWKAEVGN